MDKKKLFTASLASVAVLGAGFLASHPSVVKAEEAASTAVTKEDVAEYFTDLEKKAEKAINENAKITDKEAAILEAKAAIGKEDLLKAIDEKQITPEDVLKDLAEASKTESDEAEAGKYGENYAPQEVKDAKPAPGAELVRNESGEVTEVKPIDGRSEIDADAQDKINKRLDEEKTDVKDAEERLAAANHDEKEAESNREEAKVAVESAKENVKAAQEELAAAKDPKSKEEAEKTLKQAEQDLKDAEDALEQANEDYYSYVADREAEEVRLATRNIAKLKAEGKDTTEAEKELDLVLNGVEPLVQPELPLYVESEQPKLPNDGGPYPGDRYIINKPAATPAGTPATTPAGTPATTPADAPAATSADAPAATSAGTPATTPAEAPATTPAVAPTVAVTNKDNTYQAPAAKAEDKKELPNTGGKDNAAVASLGFLGLLLGALPFVKRKN